MKRMLAVLLMLFLALMVLVPASASALTCPGLMKDVKALAKYQRTANNPLANGRAAGKASTKAHSLRDRIHSNLDACDWDRELGKVRGLGPYAQALADAGENRSARKEVIKGYLEVQVKFMALLPDETVCHVVGRTVKAGRGSSLCFKGQLAGVTDANLKLLARGWCKARKVGQSGRNYGIETNKLAELFGGPGLPSGVVDEMLSQLVDRACPSTR